MVDDSELFIYFGEIPINLAELGEIRDMPITEAFQAIIDNGYLGQDLVGMPWYELVRPNSFSLESQPEEDNALLYSLWRVRKDAEEEYAKAVKAEAETDELRVKLIQCNRDYQVAKKLCKP